MIYPSSELRRVCSLISHSPSHHLKRSLQMPRFPTAAWNSLEYPSVTEHSLSLLASSALGSHFVIAAILVVSFSKLVLGSFFVRDTYRRMSRQPLRNRISRCLLKLLHSLPNLHRLSRVITTLRHHH
jgi:hypothetical protein